MLYPAAIAIGWLADRFATARPTVRWIGTGLLLACCLEQAACAPTYQKTEARARVAAVAPQIDRSAKAFYWSPVTNDPGFMVFLDAMWASTQTEVPTIDGYSGLMPPGYQALGMVRREGSKAESRAFDQALEDWCRRNKVRPSEIQRIPSRPSDAP
jgi:hypothetical protein